MPTDEEIVALIRGAANEADKAQLTVLFQLNKNLEQNTKLTLDAVTRLQAHEKAFGEHRVEFQKHVSDEAALFNKGIGAWKTLAIASLAIGSLGGYILTVHLGDLREVIKINGEQEVRINRLETATPISREASTRLGIVETQITNNTGSIIDLTHRLDDIDRDVRRSGKR